jgi:hypothetical protein
MIKWIEFFFREDDNRTFRFSQVINLLLLCLLINITDKR